MELKIYEHKAQYYETDQMGIIHHANYLHWFEEARIDMMEQMGMGYDIMEKQGIISPVLSVHCDYKSMARFGETVQVLVQMKEYNGIRMTLEYTVSLKRNYIEMDRAFREYSEQSQKEE